jgi:hypothetical protein
LKWLNTREREALSLPGDLPGEPTMMEKDGDSKGYLPFIEGSE